MTRQAFMARLREGLSGLNPQARADILADYEEHFTEGAAAGRSEEDVAAGLGDPDRLARELTAESALRRWEDHRSPAGAAGAVFGLLGLGALDILIMFPVLTALASVLFAFAIAALGVFFAGGAVFAAGPFTGMPGGPPAALLLGLGLMTGAIAVGALTAIAAIGLINAVVWYARLHYRVLRPALEPSAAPAFLDPTTRGVAP
jgi:uncharacterized membrane protein